jgi:hypothetical protein
LSIRSLWAISQKESRHITRDYRILFLFLVTISPAFLLFTLAYVFAFDVNQVAIGVVDHDKSALS